MSTMRASDTPAAFSAGANPAPTVSLRLLFLFILLLASTASLANGRIGPFNVYTIDGRFADPDRTSTLYRIDPETGEVLETIGDTGLRLNAITLWPEGNRLIAVTSADDPQFSNHIVELDRESARVKAANPLEIVPGPPIPPGAVRGDDAPFSFRDVTVKASTTGEVQLVLYSEPVETTPQGSMSVIWESLPNDPGSLPDGRITPLRLFGLPASTPTGLFGIATADWNFDYFADLSLAGCGDQGSALARPFPLGGPIIDPPPPPASFVLPEPSCFSSLLNTGANRWLGVQTDPTELPPRRLTRITLNGDQASLEDLGPLPDNTVGIAFGPAFPVEPVPALSRMALIVLLGLVAAVVVLRRRARA